MRVWTNGYRSWGTVFNLTRFHRIPGSVGFDGAVEYLKGQLCATGYTEDEVKILEYPADGVTKTETWIHPLGWNVLYGELVLEEPEREFLLSTEYTPLVVMLGSAPCNGKFEVVDVGKGEDPSDYEGKDVKGKLVLANGDPGKVFDLAVERYGASGMLSYFLRNADEHIERTGKHQPHMVNYVGLRRDRESFEKGAVGFSVPFALYARLKKMTERDRVVVRVRIDVETGGTLKVLEARFKGKNPEMSPVVVMAHLCHPSPGANDNASGSAALLEIARIMKENNFELQRDVVFLWVPEMFGSVPYFLNNHSFWYGINLDMVGEDQEKTHSKFLLVKSPWSTNGFADHFIHAALTMRAPMGRRLEVMPYSGGSDHYVIESFGVGCPFLGHWPDTFYHTNFDTSQMVDPSELAWTINSVVDSLLWTTSEESDLKPRSIALRRILSSYMKDLTEFLTVMETEDHPAVKHFMAEKVRQEYEEMKKVLDFPPHIKAMVDEVVDKLDKLKAERINIEDDYYRKTFKGPLGNAFQKLTTFEERREIEKLFPETNFTSNSEEILNLLERGLGVNAAHKIFIRQFGEGLSLEKLKRYLEILETKGLLQKI
ncbi:MAG: aminopeptidase YwaD [Thermotogota bacterium]|nr:aminopeptidase YwaD [Thermotogota bacterium]